jgi:hypothetical protein
MNEIKMQQPLASICIHEYCTGIIITELIVNKEDSMEQQQTPCLTDFFYDVYGSNAHSFQSSKCFPNIIVQKKTGQEIKMQTGWISLLI